MIAGIDPTVDYVFKKLFGSEANLLILVDILHAVLDPPAGRELVSLEIRNPFNEKEAFDDKLSVVDIKARDQRGENYNLEMQMCATPTYPERVLYYWARIYAE